jgi:hypothetical protein
VSALGVDGSFELRDGFVAAGGREITSGVLRRANLLDLTPSILG